ncbi:MAG TPA: Wadjet anti-phage system protein JetD domain-containing protein [Ramlibacter sp.]|nr:Wadjet anti-phage system protein JetD domain-containing protein [Ramlibacter sp.]
MIGPADLAARLRRQWDRAALREERLLGGDWPLRLAIAAPSSPDVRERPDAVRRHLLAWQAVDCGVVEWQERSYRSAAEPVRVPAAWVLASADDWVRAMRDPVVERSWQRLRALLAQADPRLRPALVRQLRLVDATTDEDLGTACALVPALRPGLAAGLPLRAVPSGGGDTKFWERNAALLTLLLEALHPGQVRDGGLEGFLGAARDGEHWLYLVDLQGSLLPWRELRIRDGDLHEQSLPGDALLVVENLQCRHQLHLPQPLPGTVAVLGCGLNLAWMAAPWVRDRRVAYWGDLDTWGLAMLARARSHAPHLRALLMDEATLEACGPQHAVPEPVPAPQQAPAGLTAAERALYERLRSSQRGRLEQEFVPAARVQQALLHFAAGAG